MVSLYIHRNCSQPTLILTWSSPLPKVSKDPSSRHRTMSFVLNILELGKSQPAPYPSEEPSLPIISELVEFVAF